MNQKNEYSGTVRRALAEHTHAAHETLHNHHWISSLTRPTLTPAQYHRVLSAYLHFYRHIEAERRRLEELDQFSLGDAIACLESDTATFGDDRQHSASVRKLSLHNASSALGALYVLHGARFGAAIINKQVSKSLPDASRLFLQNSTSLQQWRHLVEAIESTGADLSARKDLFSGADRTFSAFGQYVTEYCESIDVMPANQEPAADPWTNRCV